MIKYVYVGLVIYNQSHWVCLIKNGGFNQQIMGLSTWEYLGYRTEDSTHEAFQGDFTRKNWSRNRPKFVIQYIQWVYVVVFQRFCIYF